uniref:Protein kinase domain-containing protein n=1 Tax=Meloidogyne incognita TaxID=6306 RepID=A0A914MFM1_MELIC
MFTETEVASCADCLCRALAYLHTEHLIVHRDVKLENLLVYYIPDNQSGQRLMIKLADFGLACQLESADQLLILLCGTPTYVAPEVLAEFGYSFKADCWSVGIILYCLLCGYPPFGVDEPDDVLFNRILRGQFHFPSPVFDSISNSAKLLITRLLNTDPFMRASATDVVEWHWTKGLANVSQENELEAEEQLAIAIAGMLMLDDDDDDEQQKQYSDDFAMSESSAEFFFSRRASMDELLCEDDNDDEEEGGGEQGKMLLFSSIATTIATNVFSSSAIATASFSATTNSVSNPPNASISTDVTKLIRSDSPYEFPPIQLPPISQSLLATAMPSLLPSSNTDLHLLEQQQQQQTSSSLASLATDKRKRQRGDSIKKHQNIKIDFQQPQKLQQHNEKEASSLASVDKIISSCVGGINKEATQQTTPRMQRKIILQPQQSTTSIRRKQNLRHISLDDNGVIDDNNEIGRIAVTNVNNNNTPTAAAATTTRTTTTTAASTGRRQRRTATIR